MSYTPGQRVEVRLVLGGAWRPGTVKGLVAGWDYFQDVRVALDDGHTVTVANDAAEIRTTEDYCPACKTEGVTEGAMH